MAFPTQAVRVISFVPVLPTLVSHFSTAHVFSHTKPCNKCQCCRSSGRCVQPLPWPSVTRLNAHWHPPHCPCSGHQQPQCPCRCCCCTETHENRQTGGEEHVFRSLTFFSPFTPSPFYFLFLPIITNGSIGTPRGSISVYRGWGGWGGGHWLSLNV